jgi:trehalose-6-phosphate synthase
LYEAHESRTKQEKVTGYYSERHESILRPTIHDSWNNSPTNFSKAVGEFMGI